MIDLLQKSIHQYRSIIEYTKQLEALLKNAEPGEIRAYTARLNELQHEAGLYDKELLSEIAHDSVRWQAHPLFQQRMQLLEQIVEMNHLLLPRIHGMMAVTGSELAQLKEGRTALTGYYPGAGRPQKKSRGVG